MTLVEAPYGVWLGPKALPGTGRELQALAAGIESLGYGALWLGGSWGSDLSVPEALLEGSSNLVVGTSITNIWRDPAADVATAYTRVAGLHGDRFVLGIGAGHHVQTQWNHNDYRRPLARLSEFLDVLDDATPPVPRARRALASLGPKALDLAAARSAGTLPYLVTPEHTASAREQLGAGPFIGTEQMAVLSTDPEASARRAREALASYMDLPNYTNAWRRLGFDDTDIDARTDTGRGSDRLVAGLVVQGGPAEVKARLDEHLAAGADHVCVQPLPVEAGRELDDLRALAAVLF